MDILFCDRWLLVVNKPAGLLSIQDGYDFTAPHVRTLIESEFGRCWIVHRLDKETSGAMLLARTSESHRLLSLLFEERKISKEYRCVIEGTPVSKHLEINFPLRINGDRRHRTVIDLEKGKSARTEIDVISTSRDISYVAAKPATGYTHQIRAHLAHIGHPLLGDTLYNRNWTHMNSNKSKLIDRVALHSHLLTFIHPFTNEVFSVSAPFPPDLENLLSKIK